MLKAELHVHSLYSKEIDDPFLGADMTIENIAKTCAQKGIEIFALTDHDRIDGWEEGAYWAKKFGLLFIPAVELSTAVGHVLALGLKKAIAPHQPLKKALEEIHRQGGVAVAAHPFQFPYAVLFRFLTHQFDAVEALHAYAIGNTTTKLFNKLGRLPETAGSDAHYLREIGLVYTLFPDTVRTYWDCLSAIKEGRVGIGGRKIGIIKAMVYRLKTLKKNNS